MGEVVQFDQQRLDLERQVKAQEEVTRVAVDQAKLELRRVTELSMRLRSL